MSTRKLGGGRILGNGKGLAPSSTPPSAASPALSASKAPIYSGRAASPLPSESTVSRDDSDTPSGSPLPDGSLDLTSNISLGAASSSVASSRLVCPICEEEMLTLLQLNRHIDDAHQELPEVEQDEVKSWFDKQVLKAKRFQPLSQITQKLRGLDVFESNETVPLPPSAAPASSTTRVLEVPIDPDELIIRKHWQRSNGNDVCTDPLCGKGLGPLNGSVNCRHCGRLFCEEHTMYQMRLSRSANHEPVKGYWARVCETCYKSREGYNDHNGTLIDHTSSFVEMRRKRVERQNLEISRLEKRLTKLTKLLANPPEEITANGDSRGLRAATNAFGGDRNKRKALEQMVVTWEDDSSVSKCPFCQQEFGSWTFRRHHCRICGKVVCSDPQTACSTEVGLSVASATTRKSEKPENDGQIDIDIRMCRDCKSIIFSKRDFQQELSHKPPDQRAYETLRQFERGIRLLMPSFQRTLLALQPEEDETPNGKRKSQPTHAQIQEASKIRKRLTDSFTKYDLAARRLRDMKTDSPTQQRLQNAIYTAASSFLHQNMLPLKSVPRMLKAHSKRPTRRLLTNGHGPSALRNEDSSLTNDTSSVAGSEASTQVSVLEQEEKELREQLVVLEEQRFMVKEMIEGAKGRRRFEEVSSLTRNAEELDGEIEKVRNLVSGVEGKWEELYAQGVAQSGH